MTFAQFWKHENAEFDKTLETELSYFCKHTMTDLTSARYVHQELFEKYQQCTTAIDTCGLKTDILDS
jgi:hypothetical protein